MLCAEASSSTPTTLAAPQCCAGAGRLTLRQYTRGALRMAQIMTAPKLEVSALLAANLNGTVSAAQLTAAVGKQGSPQCGTIQGQACVFTGILYCIAADKIFGVPVGPMKCPPSAFYPLARLQP